MTNYRFTEDPKGGVGMEIVARDYFDMFTAAVSALCLFMWDQNTVEEREEVPIAWYGFNIRTTVVGLLSEMLYRMETDGWVFKRFVTHSLEEVDDRDERLRRKQLKVSGVAYGERFDRARHRARFPVRAVLLPRLKVKQIDNGVRLYCVLDA
jgi:SHS2 domain-containing protein